MTKKQKAFVEEYLIDLNATQAAIRAGYSPETAGQIGSENLKKLEIQNAIAKARADRSRRTGITQDRVLREIAKIAFVNAKDVINLGVGTVNESSLDEDLSTIASVKVKTIPTEEGNIEEREVKLYDKLKALDMLGRHLGMYNDKLELSGQLVKIVDDINDS